MNDAQDLEVGAHGRVDSVHHYVFDFSGAHSTEVDLARRLNVRQIAPYCYGHFRRGSSRMRATKRRAWNRELHHADGDHSFVIAHFHDSSDAASQSVHFGEVSDLERFRGA